MTSLHLTKSPVARAEMFIRKPPAVVYEAFVDPAVTSQFWFTHGSDRLDAGAPVEWTWEMYGFSTLATALALEPERRIVVEWGSGDDATTIEWLFRPVGDGTFVSVSNFGFTGEGDAVVDHAIASTEGFTFVLAGAKAWLEHGIRLNLVGDRFPEGLPGAEGSDTA